MVNKCLSSLKIKKILLLSKAIKSKDREQHLQFSFIIALFPAPKHDYKILDIFSGVVSLINDSPLKNSPIFLLSIT